MKRVYLCGPITGCTYDEATVEREKMVEKFKERGVEALSPMRGKIFYLESRNEALKAKGHVEIMSTDKAIVKRDKNDVKNSDLIFADLRGAKKTSIGSMVEYGWADAMGIPIITVMEEETNPHDHAFVHQLSTYVTADVDEAFMLAMYLLNARG